MLSTVYTGMCVYIRLSQKIKTQNRVSLKLVDRNEEKKKGVGPVDKRKEVVRGGGERKGFSKPKVVSKISFSKSTLTHISPPRCSEFCRTGSLPCPIRVCVHKTGMVMKVHSKEMERKRKSCKRPRDRVKN